MPRWAAAPGPAVAMTGGGPCPGSGQERAMVAPSSLLAGAGAAGAAEPVGSGRRRGLKITAGAGGGKGTAPGSRQRRLPLTLLPTRRGLRRASHGTTGLRQSRRCQHVAVASRGALASPFGGWWAMPAGTFPVGCPRRGWGAGAPILALRWFVGTAVLGWCRRARGAPPRRGACTPLLVGGGWWVPSSPGGGAGGGGCTGGPHCAGRAVAGCRLARQRRRGALALAGSRAPT